MPLPSGRPARVPWLEDGSPDAVPRFICDVMTEGLARQLRLCGIDARSAPVAAGRQRYHAYMELVDSATRENRIVLTADTIFLRARWAAQSLHVVQMYEQPQPVGKLLHGGGVIDKSHWLWRWQPIREPLVTACNRYTDQAYWVRTTNKRDQLLEVLAAFNIEVKQDSLLSRCAKCNGTFIPRWKPQAL